LGRKPISFIEEICLDKDVLQRKAELLQKELEEVEKQISELKMRRNYLKSELRKALMRLEELRNVCKE